MFNFFEKNTKENPEIIWFIVVLVILFILWLLTGGPEQSYSERDNQFLRPLEPIDSGETYHRDVFPRNWKDRLFR